MFGHNDQHHDTTLPEPADNTQADDQATAGSTPPADDQAGDFLDDVSAPSTPPTVTQPGTDTADVPVIPAAPTTADDAATTGITTDAPRPTTPVDSDALLNIKQQALQQLTPLIGHLDQSPEEKFRTTMMMIQAADNHELIQAAYEAAQRIEDEKVRAQALLDIVNEINYFTHNNANAVETEAVAA
jgi:hypothetical protein